MPNMEKVISNLQVVHNYLKSFENTAKMGEWVGDALALLKGQEAVEPVEEFIKGANLYEYHCRRCGKVVGTIFDDKHPIFPGAKASIQDAMMRHMFAYLDDPDGVDEESGLPHIWHLATNVEFLCEMGDKEICLDNKK